MIYCDKNISLFLTSESNLRVTLAPKRRQQRSGGDGSVGVGGDGGRKKISISISIAAKLDHLRRRNTCAFRLPAATGLHIHFAAMEKARRVHRVIDLLPSIREGEGREREGPSIGRPPLRYRAIQIERSRIYESRAAVDVLKTSAPHAPGDIFR